MKTYLDIGPSTLRKFAYCPDHLNVGDTVITIDPEIDLGTQGAVAEEKSRVARIYPNSGTANAAMQRRALEIPDEVRESSTHWQTTDYIYYRAMMQMLDNQRYEKLAEQAGVHLIQTTGDGRTLHFPDGSIDEVVLQNVAGDKEVSEDDVLSLAEQAIRVGNSTLFLETYTPAVADPKLVYAARTLGLALNRRRLSVYERGSATEDMSRFNFVHRWSAHGPEVVLYEFIY